MKKIILILLFIVPCLQAEIIAEKVVLKATRLSAESKVSFSCKDGSVVIGMDDGKVALGKVSVDEAAVEFWKKVIEFSEVADVAGDLAKSGCRPTHISIPCKSGYVSICLADGTVRWPKVPDMDKDAMAFWDAVVCAFKGSPAETLAVSKAATPPIKIK
jgi:hypothetical protein